MAERLQEVTAQVQRHRAPKAQSIVQLPVISYQLSVNY